MSSRTRTLLTVLVSVLALALAACGGDSDTGGEGNGGDETTAPAEPAETEPAAEEDTPAEEETAEEEDTAAEEDAAAGGATVAVASSDLGDILVDDAGMTLYVFLPDDQGAPTCTDDCAQAWPPLAGPAEAGEGADAGLLGTAEHPAGMTQVTYNGWPLYYFANDQAAGDTNGQGVGDVWYVVGPDGEPIQDTAAAQGSAGY